ncbi:MAG: bifunctional adenosylcobinamide kinase/adenosylcobinamide-phosphate guanylyltransferase [Ramlibacter sp.]
MRELILGGQRSGKSARAEMLAARWLGASSTHRSVFIATATAWDDEMRERIARHRSDRAQRVPGMVTVEEPVDLVGVLAQYDTAHTLVVVDCLTLWLTNLLMPAQGEVEQPGTRAAALVHAIATHTGSLILVSNEIGLGVIPLGAEVRAFVDTLGRLNQQVAAACDRVTLMAAGLPLTLKGNA